MIEQFIENFDAYLHGSSLLAYLAAYIGGILVGFTPCIYPIIPIVIAYIGVRSVQSRLTGFLLSVIYVSGMAITYTVLGGVAALSGRLFGQMQTNPWIYFAIANVCIFLGLSMLDVFTISIPMPAFLAKMQSRRKRGFFGSFLLGATSGFLVGPCTAPVLAVLLVFVATKQNIAFGMSLLFVFAMGMGTLMIILGAFIGLLANLPKSGTWTVVVKKVGGLILLGMGEYYLIIAGQLWL
ncbi:MAG: cytochrome c biogenesis protein CcdA [Syntrophales bacterium]